ncbi:helix-turn-helix domain-containing protein [Streptococcus uberis]|uniref:helix-turn-helix domain-containing protein n=1 Tax=Streptococcus uberis TaxID=1349 RepID=UPI001FF2423E|nr:helix-turn-helix transcriptional regulator [Streptococcus uberis]MCK1225992.1 helix-turn-helix domain-containing protein [Streptococcus uberis]
MFSVFEKVKELCEKHGISLNTLEENLGYGRNSLYSLKNKKPNAERLQEIADYFNVSTDYLLGRTDNPNIATDNNQKTVDLKKAIAGSMSYDGKPLTEDEINYLADVFELHMKMKDK